MTFSLSRGALKLAQKKVVVKRLSAIEDLGGIEVLATDKTGTITENKLTVREIYAADKKQALFYANLASADCRQAQLEPFDIALWSALSRDEQKAVKEKGASMRLGTYECAVKKGSLAHRAYGLTSVSERHRHRFEVNNKFRKLIEESGLLVTGTHAPKNLVEIVELKDHPWFLAVQFHPEFKSRPEAPHPLFRDFIAAALTRASSDKGRNAPSHAV